MCAWAHSVCANMLADTQTHTDTHTSELKGVVGLGLVRGGPLCLPLVRLHKSPLLLGHGAGVCTVCRLDLSSRMTSYLYVAYTDVPFPTTEFRLSTPKTVASVLSKGPWMKLTGASDVPDEPVGRDVPMPNDSSVDLTISAEGNVFPSPLPS